MQPLDIVKTRFQLSREANPKLQGPQMWYRIPGIAGPYCTVGMSIEELDRLGKIVSKEPFDFNAKKEWIGME